MVEEFDGEEFDGEAGRKDDSSACVARRAGTCTADLYLCLYVQPQPLEPATFPGPCKRTGNRGWLAVSKTTRDGLEMLDSSPSWTSCIETEMLDWPSALQFGRLERQLSSLWFMHA
jgi:hypothetical protein